MDTARTWTPRALGLIAFALYALLAPPGPFWLDSGELSAAGFGLGSAHPTGFPLYCAVVRLFGYLPLGELAFRAHLASAAMGAVTIYAVARLLLTVTSESARSASGPVVAVAGAFTLMGSLIFARHATAAEVYAPTTALVALSLLWFQRVVRGGDARAGVALGVLGGLGLAVHVTYGLVLLPVAIHLGVRLYRGARWPLLVPILVVAMAGAAYAYLPVRSATGKIAAIDWDHPRTLDGVVRHVTAERIRLAFGGEMRSRNAVVVKTNARRFTTELIGELGVPAVLFAFVGLLWLGAVRRTRWLGVAIAMLIAGDFVYSVWMNPMGLGERQNGVVLLVAVAVAVGAGVQLGADQFRRGAPFAAAVFAVVAALPAWFSSAPALVAGARADLSRPFAELALDEAPVRSVLLLESDSLAATSIFLSTIEQARPDVAVLVRQHVQADRERTVRVLAAAGVRNSFASDQVMATVLGLGRPVLWELGVDGAPAGTWLVPGAVVSRLVGVAPTGEVDVMASARRLQRVFATAAAAEPFAQAAQANALTGLGRLALANHRSDVAEALFSAAIGARPTHAAAWTNRAVVVGARRDFALAAELSERAAALEPLRVGAWVNAARYRLRTNEDGRAAAHVAQALALDAESAEGWALSALIAARAGRLEAAHGDVKRALAIDPANADALDVMRQLQRR